MFTTPCFLRHNTKDLIGKLKDLGYRPYSDDNIPYDWCIVTSFVGENNDVPYAGIWSNSPDPRCYNPIDCGNNEDLFLAIAALRDDSDKDQWFVSLEGHFFQSKDDVFNVGMANYIHFFPTRWHKATVEELIKQFKER